MIPLASDEALSRSHASRARTRARKSDRTGTGDAFHLRLADALRTSRPDSAAHDEKVHFKSVAYELLWFLKGETNVRWLQGTGSSIWESGPTKAASSTRPTAPVAQLARPGRQRDRPDRAGGESIRTRPDSRRHIVTAWNPAEIEKMKLPPCHVLFQSTWLRRLSCKMYQRSADIFLGVPFNIASYALPHLMCRRWMRALSPENSCTRWGCASLSQPPGPGEGQLARAPRTLPRIRRNRASGTSSDFVTRISPSRVRSHRDQGSDSGLVDRRALGYRRRTSAAWGGAGDAGHGNARAVDGHAERFRGRFPSACVRGRPAIVSKSYSGWRVSSSS